METEKSNLSKIEYLRNYRNDPKNKEWIKQYYLKKNGIKILCETCQTKYV